MLGRRRAGGRIGRGIVPQPKMGDRQAAAHVCWRAGEVRRVVDKDRDKDAIVELATDDA
jgi:hypothetical protein